EKHKLTITSKTTFRPKKSESNSKLGQLKQYAAATLGTGNLQQAVVLPTGEDEDEWLAVNVVDFFNQIKMLWSTLAEFCSIEKFPTMTAGPQYEYLWQDDLKYKRPTQLPATIYIQCVLEWLQSIIDDDAKFPSEIGVPFPRNFKDLIRQMVKRIFRIYAHIYCHHFSIIVALGEEAHLNTSFKHFMFFVREFDLLDDRETGPVKELIQSMMESEKRHSHE
ncbi:Maintenance of ploidy protein mob1, partial [Taphrina deformans PYCC 5710]